MDLSHRLVGLPGKDHEAALSVDDTEQTAKIQNRQIADSEKVFSPLCVTAPLIKPGRGKDDAAFLEAVSKRLLFPCGLCACVDKQLPVLVSGETEDCRQRKDFFLPRNHGRRSIAGKDFTRLILPWILSLHRIDDGDHFLIIAFRAEVISAAHICSPPLV